MLRKSQSEVMQSWSKCEDPVVSICCITYNHEPYIGEAIDSFLMQETGFPFEILINDDCSTDKTVSVIEEYERKYPDIVKPLYQKENQFSKGVRPTPTFNFPRVKGKYIAMCEGDDCWTDPLKLNKQVDFLESNLAFSGCGHQVNVTSSSAAHSKRGLYRKNIENVLYKDDFLRDCPFHTSSLVFKSDIIKNDIFLVDVLSGDKALMMLISRFGLIKYFDQPMSNYRLHEGGISGCVTMKMMEMDLNIIPWILKVDPNFQKYIYASYLHETIMLFPVDLKPLFFLKHFSLFVFYSFSYFPKNILAISKMILRLSKSLVKRLKSKVKLALC